MTVSLMQVDTALWSTMGDIIASNERYRIYAIDITATQDVLARDVQLALRLGGAELILDAIPHVGSFVLVDDVDRVIHMQRDRLGIGRLYWQVHDGLISVSNDLRQIRRIGPARSLSAESICLYLVHQYFPYDTTPFNGVYKVEPGSRVSLSEGRFFKSRYWTPQHGRDLTRIEEFEREVVEISERVYGNISSSFTAAGLMCSGGVDSTANAAWLAQKGTRPTALTATFSNTAYDESPYAAEVSRLFHLPHEFVKIDASAVVNARTSIASLIEPIGDQAVLATSEIMGHCQRTNLHFDAIISGEGGDELWGMPRRFDSASFAGTPIHKTQKIAARYLQASACMSVTDAAYLMSASLDQTTALTLAVGRLGDLYERMPTTDLMSVIKFGHLLTWLPENVLTKDISIFRSHDSKPIFPLIADQFVDAYCRSTADVQAKVSVGKCGLRSTYEHLVSPFLADKKKHRFILPMDQWMSEVFGLFVSSYADTDPELHRIFSESAVRSFLGRCTTQGEQFHRSMWTIIVLLIWLGENRGRN